ncbi:MAG: DUF779 domain-containing protein [Herminiimonas sp.]|nr:DUF779 domain-containing protein [Herminiimonas sp.]
MQATDVVRIKAMPAALALLAQLRSRYGALMFFQSGGCCDGSSPMCYQEGEFPIGDGDVHLGELDGAPFYMGADQFEYWRHTQLIIDVVDGMGGMFSLDNGTGKRFLTRSRLFTDEENVILATHPVSCGPRGSQRASVNDLFH